MEKPGVSPEFVALDATRPDVGECQIKRLCMNLLPGWTSLEPSSLQVEKMSGGISNLLVKVTPPGFVAASNRNEQGLRPVAVKVFGDKTELLIDRDKELEMLLHLNRVGFGAKVMAVFGNGRIEEFMNAYTLTPEDMASPLFIPRIAQRLRQLHEIRMECQGGQQTLAVWHHLQLDDVDLEGMAAEVNELQRMCAAAASPVVFSHNDLLSGNILVLQEPHVNVHDSSQVDLRGPLQFIDFEYSAPSYRGFDLGNHFNEYAGFDCDYSRYPGPEAQALFFWHYTASGLSATPCQPQPQPQAGDGAKPHISASSASPTPLPQQPELQLEAGAMAGDDAKPDYGSKCSRDSPAGCPLECSSTAAAVLAPLYPSVKSDGLVKAGQENGHGQQQQQQQQQQLLQGAGHQHNQEPEGVSQDTLDRLSAEANLFALASHAYWGIWALIQARYSPINFDYLEYSGLRWAEYHRRKYQFMTDARRVLGIS
ncbi:kinase-like domain-containing protein [Dunaliella salina]|uniref:ethanolamine kinase n=1 Tax=Dunaliella salina TaxID=3046 RepID=A0ABQ7GEC9_DUNSA|nr:kinase-like domain-containing protein [Dunaliella salina]|eukprot:KAF5832967.1 kinase-like domain-containing protein [Dunaliella salina]